MTTRERRERVTDILDLAFKDTGAADWWDEPQKALNGLTPDEAWNQGTPALRDRVENLAETLLVKADNS